MTYFLKRDPKRGGKTHIFDEDICACDDLEHEEFKYIREGIKISLVSCKKCMKQVVRIVEKELREVLNNL